MKILIFNWRDIKNEWAGGSEVYIFELAKRWIKMGHTVTLFCGQDIQGMLPEEEVINGINVVRRGNRYTLYFWAFYYYITRFKNTFDLVIDVQNGTPFFTPIYSRLPIICVVHHVHGKQFFYEFPFPLSYIGYIIERFIFPLFYKSVSIITVSKTTRGELVKLGFNRKNIEIVYNGVNEKVKNGYSSLHKFSHPTILYLGRIKKYKRVDMLIKIMPEILKSVPKAHLLIAGWGTEGTSVMDISVRSGIRKRIKIIGTVSEKEKKYLLTRSWVFVNPSIGEGWGISVIEANMHATPAIAFKVSGLSESIQDGKTGLLVKSDDELIKKVSHVLTDAKLRKNLSKNAQVWAKKFNWDSSANQSIKKIKKVVSKHKSVRY